MVNPGVIQYSWYPDAYRAAPGTAPTGVYWIRGLRARHTSPGELAMVTAVSEARPDPAVTTRLATTVQPWTSPSPALTRELTWRLGARPAPRQLVRLRLVDVATLGVDLCRAGLSSGRVVVTTDGPTLLTLFSGPRVQTLRLVAGTTTVYTTS
jgi:hypothetical protein